MAAFAQLDKITEDEELDESPIPEVRSVVPNTDNPEMGALTFRVSVIGPIACGVEAYFCTKALFDKDAFDLPMILVQTVTLLVGLGMAATLPTRVIRVWRTGFEFSLNPGPFNIKEHVLICVFGYIGTIRPNMLQTIAVIKLYFNKEVDPWTGLMLVLASLLMCFLLLGMFQSWVTSPVMWWPSQLVDVVLFRTLHEKEDGPLGRWSNLKLFTIVLGISFIYHLFPGHFFPSLTAISTLCSVWTNSVTAQQIGAGRNGLGFTAFSADWPSLSDFTSDPLSTPPVVVANIFAGYVIAFYVVAPALYWLNAFNTKKFPIFSTELFDNKGNTYRINKVLVKGLFDKTKYENYSTVNLSAFTITSYSFMFAAVASSYIHIALNYGRQIWKQVNEDIHNRLMKKYQPVPTTWFFVVFSVAFILAAISSARKFGPEIDFPFSIILTSFVTALGLVVPTGIIAATTDQMLPVNVILGLIGGWLYSNQQFEYMLYNNLTYQIVTNTVSFLGFFKLGHYIKIPMRNMFTVIYAASTISGLISYGVMWNLINTGKVVCTGQELPVGSPGFCPELDMVYSTTNLWGILGPSHILEDNHYTAMILWVVVIAMVAQFLVWLAPDNWEFVKKINIPTIFGATKGVPPAQPANMNSWFIVALGFPFIAYCKSKNWSPKNRYLLTAAITAGTSLSVGAIYFLAKDGSSPDIADPCPLAKCPTAPGIMVQGCPQV